MSELNVKKEKRVDDVDLSERPTFGRKIELLDVVPRATQPRAIPEQTSHDDPRLFFNRALSWLDFNWRVVHQARDERVPLMDRVRFISIAAGNLDEFFRKRVGGLKRQVAAGVHSFGMFSCSKSTNEMNYAAQKFSRVVMGSNDIDSCNRT